MNYRMALVSLSILIFSACEEARLPKPRSYFRIDLPKKEYKKVQDDCPYSFEVPVYSEILNRDKNEEQNCWKDILFPEFKSSLHLSYKKVGNPSELYQFIEDSRNLAYKHTVKASEIDELIYNNQQAEVSGVIYEIGGNTASSIQFFLTDSSKNFLRGSLYFNASPNIDSLAPVLNFIRADVLHFIDSFSWN